jgi:NH3-dependent NAD+ synthetase
MNWMKQSSPPSKSVPSPESKKSSPEKPMDQKSTETYEEIDDILVLYTRKIPQMTDGVFFNVQVYLSRKYLRVTPAAEIQKYLDCAVAAILTRNGVQQ